MFILLRKSDECQYFYQIPAISFSVLSRSWSSPSFTHQNHLWLRFLHILHFFSSLSTFISRDLDPSPTLFSLDHSLPSILQSQQHPSLSLASSMNMTTTPPLDVITISVIALLFVLFLLQFWFLNRFLYFVVFTFFSRDLLFFVVDVFCWMITRVLDYRIWFLCVVFAATEYGRGLWDAGSSLWRGCCWRSPTYGR